jgi:hypothetical protein
MNLVITIDTEEDNWAHFTRGDNPCSNIAQLLPLQEMFDSFNAKPTYLVTYPVVADTDARSLLKRFVSENKCEIGSHCHPWNTPPFDEELTPGNTMMTNLPAELVLRKIQSLHDAITHAFGIAPVSFRGGRFAFDKHIATALRGLGYAIDTSVTPYHDWSAFGGPDFSNISPEPYWFSEEDVFAPMQDGTLLEVPATIGYLQENFRVANFLLKLFDSEPLRKLRIHVALNMLHLVNRVCLCPERFSGRQMIGLAKILMKKKFGILNMSFHSTSLKAGLNEFARTKEEEKRMFLRIREFLQFARDSGIGSVTLSACRSLFHS